MVSNIGNMQAGMITSISQEALRYYMYTFQTYSHTFYAMHLDLSLMICLHTLCMFDCVG